MNAARQRQRLQNALAPVRCELPNPGPGLHVPSLCAPCGPAPSCVTKTLLSLFPARARARALHTILPVVTPLIFPAPHRQQSTSLRRGCQQRSRQSSAHPTPHPNGGGARLPPGPAAQSRKGCQGGVGKTPRRAQGRGLHRDRHRHWRRASGMGRHSEPGSLSVHHSGRPNTNNSLTHCTCVRAQAPPAARR